MKVLLATNCFRLYETSRRRRLRCLILLCRSRWSLLLQWDRLFYEFERLKLHSIRIAKLASCLFISLVHIFNKHFIINIFKLAFNIPQLMRRISQVVEFHKVMLYFKKEEGEGRFREKMPFRGLLHQWGLLLKNNNCGLLEMSKCRKMFKRLNFKDHKYFLCICCAVAQDNNHLATVLEVKYTLGSYSFRSYLLFFRSKTIFRLIYFTVAFRQSFIYVTCSFAVAAVREFSFLPWFKFHICGLSRPYFLSSWKSISFPLSVCVRPRSVFCIKRTPFGSEFIVRINLLFTR